MRNIDENNLIWESYSQSGVIKTIIIDGDMIKLKGMEDFENIKNVTIDAETGIVRTKRGSYKVIPMISEVLSNMGAKTTIHEPWNSYEDQISKGQHDDVDEFD